MVESGVEEETLPDFGRAITMKKWEPPSTSPAVEAFGVPMGAATVHVAFTKEELLLMTRACLAYEASLREISERGMIHEDYFDKLMKDNSAKLSIISSRFERAKLR